MSVEIRSKRIYGNFLLAFGVVFVGDFFDIT